MVMGLFSAPLTTQRGCANQSLRNRHAAPCSQQLLRPTSGQAHGAATSRHCWRRLSRAAARDSRSACSSSGGPGNGWSNGGSGGGGGGGGSSGGGDSDGYSDGSAGLGNWALLGASAAVKSSEAADVELSDEFKMVHIVAMMFAAGQGVELNSVHILLGLLGSKLVPKYSGIALQVLQGQGITREGAAQAYKHLHLLGKAPGWERARKPELPPPDSVPWHPEAALIHNAAQKEAALRGDSQLRSEHLLLALLQQPETMAWEVLRLLGADVKKMKKEVLKLASKKR